MFQRVLIFLKNFRSNYFQLIFMKRKKNIWFNYSPLSLLCDSETDSPKCFRSKMLGNRANTIMPCISAVKYRAHFSKRKIKFIMDNNNSLWNKVIRIPLFQEWNDFPRKVHIGMWFYKENIFPFNRLFQDEREEKRVLLPHIITKMLVKKNPRKVMACILIFSSVIS